MQSVVSQKCTRTNNESSSTIFFTSFDCLNRNYFSGSFTRLESAFSSEVGLIKYGGLVNTVYRNIEVEIPFFTSKSRVLNVGPPHEFTSKNPVAPPRRKDRRNLFQNEIIRKLYVIRTKVSQLL